MSGMVEIDERVTRISEEFFPELCSANHDPRANYCFDDGIKWIADADPESADIIMVDSTDPVGPAKGLFSVEFYLNCLVVLRDDGLLVQQSESPLLHSKTIIKKMHADLQQAGFNYKTTLTFPQPVYPTGWWSCTLAGKNKRVDRFREADATERPFVTQYYNSETHRASLSIPEFMHRELKLG